MELIGYIGSIFLTINAVPELIRTINDGRCHIGWPMLVLWFVGEVFMTIYAISLSNTPLILNYAFNFVVVIVMLFYKARVILGYVQDDHELEKEPLVVVKY